MSFAEALDVHDQEVREKLKYKNEAKHFIANLNKMWEQLQPKKDSGCFTQQEEKHIKETIALLKDPSAVKALPYLSSFAEYEKLTRKTLLLVHYHQAFQHVMDPLVYDIASSPIRFIHNAPIIQHIEEKAKVVMENLKKNQTELEALLAERFNEAVFVYPFESEFDHYVCSVAMQIKAIKFYFQHHFAQVDLHQKINKQQVALEVITNAYMRFVQSILTTAKGTLRSKSKIRKIKEALYRLQQTIQNEQRQFVEPYVD